MATEAADAEAPEEEEEVGGRRGVNSVPYLTASIWRPVSKIFLASSSGFFSSILSISGMSGHSWLRRVPPPPPPPPPAADVPPPPPPPPQPEAPPPPLVDDDLRDETDDEDVGRTVGCVCTGFERKSLIISEYGYAC